MTHSIGDAVLVTTGRDSGRWMRIIGLEQQWLLLADGRHRKVEQPKRKNPKHVQNTVARSDSDVARKLQRGESIRNSELRRDLAILGQGKADKDQGGN